MSDNRSDAVRRAGHRLAESGWAIPATIAFCALLYVCLRIFIRDIETSIWGYQQFPTNKGGADIALYVALFFPLMQIGCGYLAIALGFDDNKSNDKWAYLFTFLTLVGFSFDAGLDIYFRVYGNLSVYTFVVALFETLVIYTLGSEVGLSISLVAVLVMLPYGIRSLMDFVKRIGTGDPTVPPINNVAQHDKSVPQSHQRKKDDRRPPNALPALLRQDPGIGDIRRREQEFEQLRREMEGK